MKVLLKFYNYARLTGGPWVPCSIFNNFKEQSLNLWHVGSELTVQQSTSHILNMRPFNNFPSSFVYLTFIARLSLVWATTLFVWQYLKTRSLSTVHTALLVIVITTTIQFNIRRYTTHKTGSIIFFFYAINNRNLRK